MITRNPLFLKCQVSRDQPRNAHLRFTGPNVHSRPSYTRNSPWPGPSGSISGLNL